MPRDLTHVILADDTRSLLSKQARMCTYKNRAAFHMGAISHDSFLYGLHSENSTKMHGGFGDDTRAVVLEMLDDVRQEKNPALREKKKAFAYGFLCHTAADSVFHPFVYSVSGSQVKENNPDDRHVQMAKTRHRYVETWMDVHFLKEKRRNLDGYKPFKKVADNPDRDALSDFFCKSYQKAYGIEDDLTGAYDRSMTMQLFIGRVTKSQTLGKVLRKLDDFLDGRLGTAISGFYQKDRKIPAKLEDFKEFKHPVTGEVVHKSLKDLTKDTLACGAQFIDAAEMYIENGDRQAFLQAVPNINLDTGVENTRLSDIKQAEPLAVEELKGHKIKEFLKKGFKTLTSGTKAVSDKLRSKTVKAAYPEVRKYAPRPTAMLRKKDFQR